MRCQFVCAILALLFAGLSAHAEDQPRPMKMRDDVRDLRYCEFFVVKRQGVHVAADIYNTLGLNDCPQAQWAGVDDAKLADQFGALRIVRNGPRHFIMDRLATADLTGDAVDMQGLAMRRVATMDVPLLALVERRAAYTEHTINRTNNWVFLAGRPVFELVDPGGRVYVMQAYAQIIDPKLSYDDLAGLGSRLTMPPGWSYRARVLDQDLVASASGEATIIQDDLQNTYQRLPGP
jgi:hypothetical protein